jgi:hypothetical protein
MDHKNPENKINAISNMMLRPEYTIEDIKIELEKCRMLCAHCHKIHTQKQHDTGILKKKIQNKKSKNIEVIYVLHFVGLDPE